MKDDGNPVWVDIEESEDEEQEARWRANDLANIETILEVSGDIQEKGCVAYAKWAKVGPV